MELLANDAQDPDRTGRLIGEKLTLGIDRSGGFDQGRMGFVFLLIGDLVAIHGLSLGGVRPILAAPAPNVNGADTAISA